jgi:NAD(P)-dependent dehydrogenase (short-subunit alcohol dehydrogenase family)
MQGRVATISGGARGIGRATAAALIAQGAQVAIGDIDGAAALRTAEELGGGTVGLPLDVTSRASFEAFLDQARQRLGEIDIFINNAGILPIGRFEQEPDELTARVLEVNVLGVMLGCKLAIERLAGRQGGHIVNVASMAGKVGLSSGVSYCTSKHAVIGLSEAIRAELAGSGTQVHIVMPTPVATDMAAGQRRLRGVRTLRPEQVADAIVAALNSGRVDVYVPRSVGMLVRLGPLAPRAVSDRVARLLGRDRVFGRADPLARAAYEARIAPAPPHDPAASVASAAASVADAVGDH